MTAKVFGTTTASTTQKPGISDYSQHENTLSEPSQPDNKGKAVYLNQIDLNKQSKPATTNVPHLEINIEQPNLVSSDA